VDKELRVLIVEDSTADAEFIAKELRKGGFAHTSKWVKSKDEFLKALGEYTPDVILCDYNVPGFGAPEVLEIVKRSSPETPLIVVSDTISEDVTVDTMKLGAADYILKDRFGRLVPAVRRALEEARVVSERERAQEKIRASEEKFRNIFDSAIDGILLADMENKKFYMGNNAICRMLGYSQKEINNLGIMDILPEKALSYVTDQFEKQTKEEFHLPRDLPIKRKDGSVFYADVNAAPIKIAGKTYLMGFFHDTTGQKISEEMAMLKKMDKIKTEFMSAISHELCTPLATMKEFVSIISNEIPGKLTEGQKEYVDIIKGNIDRLTRLINNLLDVSKIEYGKADLKKALVDITDLANNVIHTLKIKAEVKHIEFKTLFPAAAFNVYADPDKVVQVFTNLIENAIKFTKESGQITVEIKDVEKEAVCSVADTGIGVAPENLDKLFGKFQQFSREFGAGARGIGLGLAITKGLVEMHNGRIWAESKIDKGTKFTFTLPKYSTKALVNNGIEKAVMNGSKMSIIMVSLFEFEKLKQELSIGKLQTILKDMEGVLEVYMPRQGDIVFKDTDRIVVILTSCDKEDVLRVESRLEQALEDYLTHEKLGKKIELRVGYATYPDEAKNAEKLIEKARMSRREVG